jgi:hypothetical protein
MMRMLRSIATPWTPYAVLFSRDGTRLAVGGGVFYGNGGILMVDLLSERMELFRSADLPDTSQHGAPTISGLCFSDDDRYLAASSWRDRQHRAPTYFFEVSGLTLAHRATLWFEDSWICPSGVLLSGRYTITRNHRASPRDVLVVRESPRELGIDAVAAAQHLASRHLVVSGNHVITAGRGLQLNNASSHQERWRMLVDFRESDRRVDEGLVSVALQEAVEPQLIPIHACREVTAIAATPDGQGFLTGGLEGELDRWSWDGRWIQHRLRAFGWDAPSVRGICCLPGRFDWVAVASGGEMDLMSRDTPVASWKLSTAGSPRALAAHPTDYRVAVGLKQGGWADPGGAVDLVEISLDDA